MSSAAGFEAVFRSSPDASALIAPDGTVTAVNDAWAAFTPGGADGGRSGVGADYLGTCRQAARAGAPRAREAHRALTDALRRRRPTASVTYPCTLPGGVRWFGPRCSRWDGPASCRPATSTSLPTSGRARATTSVPTCSSTPRG